MANHIQYHIQLIADGITVIGGTGSSSIFSIFWRVLSFASSSWKKIFLRKMFSITILLTLSIDLAATAFFLRNNRPMYSSISSKLLLLVKSISNSRYFSNSRIFLEWKLLLSSILSSEFLMYFWMFFLTRASIFPISSKLSLFSAMNLCRNIKIRMQFSFCDFSQCLVMQFSQNSGQSSGGRVFLITAFRDFLRFSEQLFPPLPSLERESLSPEGFSSSSQSIFLMQRLLCSSQQQTFGYFSFRLLYISALRDQNAEAKVDGLLLRCQYWSYCIQYLLGVQEIIILKTLMRAYGWILIVYESGLSEFQSS